jgi:hypothetical protein
MRRSAVHCAEPPQPTTSHRLAERCADIERRERWSSGHRTWPATWSRGRGESRPAAAAPAMGIEAAPTRPGWGRPPAPHGISHDGVRGDGFDRREPAPGRRGRRPAPDVAIAAPGGGVRGRVCSRVVGRARSGSVARRRHVLGGAGAHRRLRARLHRGPGRSRVRGADGTAAPAAWTAMRWNRPRSGCWPRACCA